MTEQVNHPKHYNQHPAGIECIDIIRHYTCDIANALKYLWRAGLKPEMGKEDAEKEIEDLKKALWYIEDYRSQTFMHHVAEAKPKMMRSYVLDVTGHTVAETVMGYDRHVSLAISALLQIGLVVNGMVYNMYGWPEILEGCKRSIQHRILDINADLLDKEMKETVDVMNGLAIDGQDYVSKPGGVREDEPDKYDPLNMIVIYGRVYCLDDTPRKKDNGSYYSPCDICDLKRECMEDGMTTGSAPRDYCHLHYAAQDQYYREVGYARYRPSFGTVEVVDEHKEHEIELRKQREELDGQDRMMEEEEQ